MPSKQECYAVEITLPNSSPHSNVYIDEEAEKFKNRFSKGVFGYADGHDVDVNLPIKVILFYLPRSEYAYEDVKNYAEEWLHECREKYPASKDLRTSVLWLTRTIIPWTPPAVAAGAVAMREALMILDDLGKEVQSNSGRAGLDRLRKLLIPKDK